MLHAPAGVTVCKQNRGTAALLGDSPSLSDNQQPGCTASQLNQFVASIEPSIEEIVYKSDRNNSLSDRIVNSMFNVCYVLNFRISTLKGWKGNSEKTKH